MRGNRQGIEKTGSGSEGRGEAYCAFMYKGIASKKYNIHSGNIYYIKDITGILTEYIGRDTIEIVQVPSRLRMDDPPLMFGNNKK